MSDAGEDLAYLAAKLARLEVDLAEARAALLLIAKDAPSICALLMADESFAAALKAAREDIVR